MDSKLIWRYQNDTRFHALVSSLVAHCLHDNVSPTDLEDVSTVALDVLRHELRCKSCGHEKPEHSPVCPKAVDEEEQRRSE